MEVFELKAGCHWFHLFVSFTCNKMLSFGAPILMAFDIRMCDGNKRDIAVNSKKNNTKLMMANLIIRKGIKICS